MQPPPVVQRHHLQQRHPPDQRHPIPDLRHQRSRLRWTQPGIPPPLDGGRVMVGLLPTPLAIRFAGLERLGMLLLMLFFFILPAIGSQIGLHLDFFSSLLGPMVDGISNQICRLFGVATRFGGH